MEQNYVVIGGAGFIGSHFVETLLQDNKKVLVIDNYSAGFFDLLDKFNTNSNLKIIELDVRNTEALINHINPFSIVIHLASNPDIAAGISNPRIDFVNGTILTESVIEAVRLAKGKRVLYASGSGVYGELAKKEFVESAELIPISPYGASKLSGEAILSAYAHMFDIKVTSFRFANVVGKNQTHGVGYDFLRRLMKDPSQLHILGDGTQSKPYIHISDVVSAVLNTQNENGKIFDVFNVSTNDQITVNEVAEIVLAKLEIQRSKIQISYAGGKRGWSGDVPKVILNSQKIRGIGWNPKHDSRQAITRSINEMHERFYGVS
jgi:UDP-glucose 4-epimerase